MVRFVLCLLFGFTSTVVAADAPAGAFIDPAAPGDEYKFQGEYQGQDLDGQSWGGQVIALGDGQFEGVGYRGGLPGAGWKKGDERLRARGTLASGVVTLTADAMAIRIDGEKLEVLEGEKKVATLKKVQRTSPTLGAKPPEGAIVLFDGTSAEAFTNGKLLEIGGEKLLAATGCSSKQKFGDHTLHLEFRTPFVPAARGQGRGNSGVYIQGRYECQVLDSFGLEGKNNECGGIYSISEPAVNMCFPPLAWQTYDIEFTAARYDAEGKKTSPARATIRHNGVVIHNDLELPHGTPGHHAEGPGSDHLFLQDHGNPVVFRNIWVVVKE